MDLTRRRLLGVAATSALPLAGCAGDGGSASTTTETTTTTATETAAERTTARTPTTTAAATTAERTTTPATTETTTEGTASTATTTEATTATTASTTTTTESTTTPTRTTTPTTAPATTTPADPDATVEIVGFAFDPVRIEVAVGATVEWVNEAGYRHDVTSARFTSNAASWEKATSLAAGESTTHAFESAGAYEYYCTIHGRGNMCGVVVVGDVAYDGTLPCQGGDSSSRDSGGSR